MSSHEETVYLKQMFDSPHYDDQPASGTQEFGGESPF
jgi:hypothetical protein